MQPTPQNNQLMSKHRVLSLKPQLRLEWRGQDRQSETEQPDHSASLGDSIRSSTRIRFSVHTTMKKPSKTAAELEASIKVEMEDICDWPTDLTISVQPDGDSWKVKVVQEGSVDDADRREMVEQIAARLKEEYDLKG